MWHSRLSSVLIVVLGISFTLFLKDINEVWGWLTMSIGAALYMPLFFRWYFFRFNGYSYGLGTLVGCVTALIQKGVAPDIPEYYAFLISSGTSALACVIGMFVFPDCDPEDLKKFYVNTRPFGWWGPVRKTFPKEALQQIDRENRMDILTLVLSLPWQTILFLVWMTLVVQNYFSFLFCALTCICLTVSLYLVWWRRLRVNNELVVGLIHTKQADDLWEDSVEGGGDSSFGIHDPTAGEHQEDEDGASSSLMGRTHYQDQDGGPTVGRGVVE